MVPVISHQVFGIISDVPLPGAAIKAMG